MDSSIKTEDQWQQRLSAEAAEDDDWDDDDYDVDVIYVRE